MASKRMFKADLVTSDAFLDMPISAQGLFFQLCMRADDDGFVDCANRTIRECQASKDDLQMLIDKRYVLTFPDSGVIVIKHWKIHNYIQKDRYRPTVYAEEKSMLFEKHNGAYTFDASKAKEQGEAVKAEVVRSRQRHSKNKFMNFDEREVTTETMEDLEKMLIPKGGVDDAK